MYVCMYVYIYIYIYISVSLPKPFEEEKKLMEERAKEAKEKAWRGVRFYAFRLC